LLLRDCFKKDDENPHGVSRTKRQARLSLIILKKT
jgi:hypothetical protein